jgi:hypothetical protein
MTEQPELPTNEPTSFDQDVSYSDFNRVIEEQKAKGFRAVAMTVDRRHALYRVTFARDTRPQQEAAA